MNKATSAIIAAAALALSGGAYAQTATGADTSQGNTMNSGTMSPGTTNQMNGTTSGYGMPGATGSESGRGPDAPPNSPQLQSTNPNVPSHTSGPKSNNSLATPSVLSPANQQ
jgi:hypothetical protein